MRLMVMALLLGVPAAGQAADFALGPAPSWVQPIKPPAALRNDGAIDLRLADVQIRMDAAGTHQYIHQVTRVLQPQALQAVGTFGAVWQPGTDRITFHRVIIHRGDQDIDVLKDGSGLQVIRREAGLESAFIDGKLTATMPIPDLRVGDEIEIAYTVDSLNPVLGTHRETDQIFPRTITFDRFYIRNSWPTAGGMRWRIGSGMPKPVESKTGDGDTVLTIDRAGFLAPTVPAQSPGRFIDANRLQVTNFADWQSLSALFAPLFDTAATPAADSPIKAEIARIAAASADPKIRALAALQLVQSQTRYLARLDGLGGYKPASADAVWKERLGDCKGKTVLLLALLRGLGIDAQAALASVSQSDGVDSSLPLAGRFDHVLVRATIGGKVYWLDGTRLGDRDLDQIAVPGFQWALPLTQPGNTLVRLVATEPALPTEEWTLDLDARDGISLPAKATGIGILRGDGASGFRTSISFLSEVQRNELLRKLWADRHDWVEIKDVSFTVDEKTGEVRIGFTGTGTMDWHVKGADASYRYQANKAFLGQVITPDRAATDPDVPVKVDERYTVTHQTILLPNGGKGFYVDGEAIDRTEAGLHYMRTASLHDGKFEMMASTRSKASEVTLAAAKAADKQATEIFNKDLYVHLPSNYAQTAREKAVPADPAGADLGKVAELVNQFKLPEALKLIDAVLAKDPKNPGDLAMKGRILFLQGKLDEADIQLDASLAENPTLLFTLFCKADLLVARGRIDDALIVYDRAVLLYPNNAAVYAGRGHVRRMAHKSEAALADVVLALEKQPDMANARMDAINLLFQLNRTEEAVAQADAYAKADPGSVNAHLIYANTLVATGRREDANAEYKRALDIQRSGYVYAAMLSNDFISDDKTKLDYLLAIIADIPSYHLPQRALTSLAHDQAAYTALVAAYDKAVVAHPENKNIAFARGVVEAAFGNFDRAGTIFDQSVAEAPKDASRLNNACWIRAIYRFQLEKALADCNQAIAIDPVATFFDSRGMVHLQRGEWLAAIADYDAALAKSGPLQNSLYGRGLAELRAGKTKEGNADLDAARKLWTRIGIDFEMFGLKP